MRYILMHGDTPVCLVLHNKEHDVLDVLEVYSLDHMPLSCRCHDDFSAPLTKWAVHRTIPSSRPYFNTICDLYGFTSRLHIALKTGGCSLTDHYWFKKEKGTKHWNEVNFFQNSYKDKIFTELLAKKGLPKRFSTSPGFMTNGIMPKAWISENGSDYLIKAGSAPDFEEPLNEYLAYKLISASCAVPVVKTSLCKVNDDTICSKTESFTGKEYEFVPACDAIGKEIKTEKALYDALMKFSEENGIKEYHIFLQSMLTADFLIGNRDRHLGNFGFLRNASTLEVIGPAPLFDNGTSLLKPECHDIGLQGSSKPFSLTWEKQIHFIRETCFDMEAFKDTLYMNLKENPKLLYSTEEKKQIENLICGNIHNLDRHFEKMKEKELER